jgi:SAM-dependent methyltransferase
MTNEMIEFDLPKTQCDICGSTDISLYVVDYKGIQIYRCGDCGIQFMNPQYSDAHLKKYYSHFTFEEPQWEEPLLYCHKYYLSLVERFATDRGKILDIGTGKGSLLVAAKQRGWEALGYDVDCESEDLISKKIGIKILCGDFFKIEWKQESFDAVYMHQVIEHLKTPLPYFDTVRMILKKGGVFFIAQPNISSLAGVVKLFLERIGLKKKHRGAHYGTEGHLWYYTPKTMKYLLERYGFEVLSMRSGHKVRPNQSKLKRFFLRNIVEVIPWKSTFLVIARKK